MNFDHAFIVTYGRSGSTLLQGVLNRIPGAEIRGENGNVLFLVHAIIQGLNLAKSFAPAAAEPTHPWYGAQRLERDRFVSSLLERFREDILPPRAGRSLIGFKEIRYSQLSYPQLSAFLDFLRENFSRSAVIFNTRDLEATILSNQRARHQVAEAQLRNADANFRRYAAEHPDFTYHVHYDDYVNAPEELRGLFDFLGAGFELQTVRETLGTTHSVRTS